MSLAAAPLDAPDEPTPAGVRPAAGGLPSRRPPSLAQRRDRLVLLVTENADAFGDALHADVGHRPGPVSDVKAKGPVNKILKLVPLTKSLFPTYRELVAEKDAARAAVRPPSMPGATVVGRPRWSGSRW